MSVIPMRSQPDPAQPQQRRGRLILLGLFVFFALPLLVVMLMVKFQWHPPGKSHGTLLGASQALTMPAGLMSSDGNPLDQTLWRDRWSLVYNTSACEATCEDQLHTMRQLHASLGKDIGRMQRVLVATQADMATLQSRYPDLVAIIQPPEPVQAFRQQFVVQGQAREGLYLVDPLGNLILYFDNNLAPADIRKDIGRLLAYAWAG